MWHEVSGNLPTDFGFPIDVHAHEPETIYVVPIKSDSEHFPPEGKLRVYRSRTGGNEWEALTKGLPQSDCYVNVLRDAMAVDSLDPAASTSAPPAARSTPRPMRGDTWTPIVRDLPAVLSVEVQTLRMIRVVLPAHLRTLAQVGERGAARRRRPGDRSGRCSMRSRPRTRCCAAPSATTAPCSGGRSSASSPASRTSRTNRRTLRCPRRWRRRRSRCMIVGAIAGG